MSLRYASITLVAFVGEQVTIRYDPRDLAEIKVYFADGTFLCKAVCQDIADLTISLRELLSARKAIESCPLLIVDEADRLSYNSLEELRAMYDEYKFGLILMGMPGIEKRLSRYAQLYSRIGFVHEFKAINKEEMKFLFEQKWQELGRQFDKETFVDVEAMNEIIKITHGNFRLINRIFDQMQRLMQINNLTVLTKELVDAAKNCLVIGDFL